MLFEKIELEPNEAVLKVVRKHWFVITIELLSTLILAFLPFALISAYVFIPKEFVLIENTGSATTFFTYGTSIWILLTLLLTFMVWTHYYLDLWIITDRRIIAIDQIHFFNRKVSSFRLERLQDIKVAINGVIPTFLNYGTIRAQTASAAENNFMTSGLPDPRELQSLIQKATDARLESLRGVNTGGIID
jgi:hypothetical protein